MQENLRGRLIDHGALVLRFSACLTKGSLCRNGGQAFVPGDDLARNACPEALDEGAGFLGRRAERAVHIARDTHDDGDGLLLGRQFDDPLARIASGSINRLERMSQQAKIVAHRHADAGLARINAEKVSVFHFQLKIPHHKPTLRNNMSSISYGKFGDTLPMTGIVALSQAAVGFGIGLLLAGKLDQTVRQRTAIAFIGAGAATILPFVAGIIADLNNRPDSSRRIRRQLASIREGTGLSNGDGAYY